MVPLLEEVMRSGRPLFVVAEDVEGEALATILLNRLRGTLNCVAIKAPGFGDRRKRILEDIAAVTGAQVVDKDFGMTIADATIDMMGTAKTVKVTKDNSLIVDGAGDKKAIERPHQPRSSPNLIAPSPTSTAKSCRSVWRSCPAAWPCSRWALPPSPSSRRRRAASKTRCRPPVRPSRKASSPAAAWRWWTRCLLSTPSTLSDKDEEVGVGIIRKALEAPMRAIAQNAGYEGSVVVEHVKGMGKGEGLNCATGEYGNMIAMGVNDPVKVTRTALRSPLLPWPPSSSSPRPPSTRSPRKAPTCPLSPVPAAAWA